MASAELNNNESSSSLANMVAHAGSSRSSSILNTAFIKYHLPKKSPSVRTMRNLRSSISMHFERKTKERTSTISLAPVPSKFKELTPMPFMDIVQKKMYTKSDEYYLKAYDEHKYGKCKLDGKCHKCKYLLRNPGKDALRQAKYFEQMKDYRPYDADLLEEHGEGYKRYYDTLHPEYVKEEYWQDSVMNNLLVPIYNVLCSAINWLTTKFTRNNNQVSYTSVPQHNNNNDSVENIDSVLETTDNESSEKSCLLQDHSVPEDGQMKSNETTPDLTESDMTVSRFFEKDHTDRFEEDGDKYIETSLQV